MLANMNIGKIITLTASLITAFTSHKASEESTAKSRNYSNKLKIKRTKSRINYYANCVAALNLVLSVDIELNPGPGSNACNNTPKCSLCNREVSTTTVEISICRYLMTVTAACPISNTINN